MCSQTNRTFYKAHTCPIINYTIISNNTEPDKPAGGPGRAGEREGEKSWTSVTHTGGKFKVTVGYKVLGLRTVVKD